MTEGRCRDVVEAHEQLWDFHDTDALSLNAHHERNPVASVRFGHYWTRGDACSTDNRNAVGPRWETDADGVTWVQGQDIFGQLAAREGTHGC